MMGGNGMEQGGMEGCLWRRALCGGAKCAWHGQRRKGMDVMERDEMHA